MPFDPLIAQVQSWLVNIGLTGAIAAAGAYGLFRWLGQEWLAGQFDFDAFLARKRAALPADE